MPATTGSVHRNSPKPNSQAYPPSVPLTVYRELSMELQATQARLDALTVQNQQLLQENQILRQEIAKVVQSFLHLQKLVDTNPGFDLYQAPDTFEEMKTAPQQPLTELRPRQQVSRPRPPVANKVPPKKSRSQKFSVPMVDMSFPVSEPVFIEEQEVSYYSTPGLEAKELSGWWLIIAILLIMLTAFGAGYLVVRPMFEHQNR